MKEEIYIQPCCKTYVIPILKLHPEIGGECFTRPMRVGGGLLQPVLMPVLLAACSVSLRQLHMVSFRATLFCICTHPSFSLPSGESHVPIRT